MRRKLYIFIVCIAVAAMWVAGATPHHHHDGGVCIGEVHAQHGSEEHGGEAGEHDSGLCVAESEFTDPSSGHRSGASGGATCGGGCAMCGDDGHDGHGHHLFLTLFPPDGFGATGDMPELSALFDVDYGKCITRWQSTPALCAGGLRAPPATLC